MDKGRMSTQNEVPSFLGTTPKETLNLNGLSLIDDHLDLKQKLISAETETDRNDIVNCHTSSDMDIYNSMDENIPQVQFMRHPASYMPIISSVVCDDAKSNDIQITSNIRDELVSEHEPENQIEHVLNYLDRVKHVFSENVHVYNTLLDIMGKFKSQAIDIPSTVEQVSNLFCKHGHLELIDEFSACLPPGQNITVHLFGEESMASRVYLDSQENGQEVNIDESVVSQEPNSLIENNLRKRTSSPTFTVPSKKGKISSKPKTETKTASLQTKSLSSHFPPFKKDSHPEEFDQTVKFLYKIKNGFSHQPGVYSEFLEILRKYLQDQKRIKADMPTSSKFLSENDLYFQVAKLFGNQEDLLDEFSKFLSMSGIEEMDTVGKCVKSFDATSTNLRASYYVNKRGRCSAVDRRIISLLFEDVALTKGLNYEAVMEFLDKVHLTANGAIYMKLLMCLSLCKLPYVMRKSQLMESMRPHLEPFPELWELFLNFLGFNDILTPQSLSEDGLEYPFEYINSRKKVESEDLPEVHPSEIDFSTCFKVGAGYRAWPANCVAPKCSNRTPMCRAVLNDLLVCVPFPLKLSSPYINAKKKVTQTEEIMRRVEDDRFEMDYNIHLCRDAILTFEEVDKEMSKMSKKQLANFHLDDCLGGRSCTLQQNVVRKMFGQKGTKMIELLKEIPKYAIPIVLKRLKMKLTKLCETRNEKKLTWKKQIDRYYLKSLDVKGDEFKKADFNLLTANTLMAEIKNVFKLRYGLRGEEAHITLEYRYGPTVRESILNDACNLLLYHVRRQSTMNGDAKREVKKLLKHFIPDLFNHPRMDLSDDESSSDVSSSGEVSKPNELIKGSQKLEAAKLTQSKTYPDESEVESEEDYTLFYANKHWYLFFRLHHLLCERLVHIFTTTVKMTHEDAKEGYDQEKSPAVQLGIISRRKIEVKEYYQKFLEMVQDFVDGNLSSADYENELRKMFGIRAYKAFTINKIVGKAVGQLKHMATDEVGQLCVKLYQDALKEGGTGSFCGSELRRIDAECSYCENAKRDLSQDSCVKVIFNKKDYVVTMGWVETLELDSGSEDIESPSFEPLSSGVGSEKRLTATIV